jgi:glycosyltransferase involved in cell wall biosynthesis
MTGLVSVVIPAFNASWSIQRTLASVAAQTWRDLEVLVVDDGSTDATAEIVGAFVARDPRFRLVRQTNHGASAARNRGLALARGDYVAPLDADDLWNPRCIEALVRALEAEGDGAVFAFARSIWIDERDRIIARPHGAMPSAIDFRELLLRNPVGNGSASLFRRAALVAAGGWDEAFSRDRRCCEDFELLLRVAWRGRIVAVDEPLVFYRVTERGKSQALERSADAFLAILERQRQHGPRLPPWDYWRARSLTMLWLLQRAVRAGRPRLAARLAAWAYLRNPLWMLEGRAWSVAGRVLAWPLKHALRRLVPVPAPRARPLKPVRA